MTNERDRTDIGAETDAVVTQTYRDTTNERAPESLNRAILDRAAKASRPRYSRLMTWTRPMAWAATVMLSVAIVLQLTQTPAPQGVDFEDRGEHELKGIAEPQRLFAVRAEGSP